MKQPIIEAHNLTKCYTLFERPEDRLKQMLLNGVAKLGGHSLGWKPPRLYREFWALRDVSLSIGQGEVIGIVGKNGAGKSTLLQLICGTLQPSSGHVAVRGRIAALLELGAGFNPEFTGRENVVMAAAILGVPADETQKRMAEIIEFSGIGRFIDQPVKTYSSGMYVRLAFSVATSVDPDILVVDEALSVGDGEFARRSFDRIMALKERGATILFCSHTMYHIQALCSRAIWMENGQMRMMGQAAEITAAYEMSLVLNAPAPTPLPPPMPDSQHLDFAAEHPIANMALPASAAAGTAHLKTIEVAADGVPGRELAIHSGQTNLSLRVEFASAPDLPCPSVAMVFQHPNGAIVASAGSANDGVQLQRDPTGRGEVLLEFPHIPLLQGDYTISIYLMCERGILVYEHVEKHTTLRVSQIGLEQGYFTMPHHWDPHP